MSNMSWRKISSQGIGTGDAIFAPFQMQNFFQDGNTGSHEKASQGVGIEKAVFTSSKHDNFIFPLPGRNRKAAECCAARPAERSVHRGLGSPQQADNGQHIYVGTACQSYTEFGNGQSVSADFTWVKSGGDQSGHHQNPYLFHQHKLN